MIKSVYKKQIAHNLDMSTDTLRRKLKSINLKISRGLISPREQKEIYIKLGYENIWKKIEKQSYMSNR